MVCNYTVVYIQQDSTWSEWVAAPPYLTGWISHPGSSLAGGTALHLRVGSNDGGTHMYGYVPCT